MMPFYCILQVCIGGVPMPVCGLALTLAVMAAAATINLVGQVNLSHGASVTPISVMVKCLNITDKQEQTNKEQTQRL